MSDSTKESLLDQICIASPCSVPWDSMTGDSTKRLCSGCSRNVFNVSDMTRNEAENFLEMNGFSHCMMLYRRPDGTIMTDNCPRVLRKMRDRCKMVARCVASAAVFLFSLPAAWSQGTSTQPAQKHVALPEGIAGGMSAPPFVEQQTKGNVVQQEIHKTGKPVQMIRGDVAAPTHVAVPGRVAGTHVVEYGNKPGSKPGDKPTVQLKAEESLYMDERAHTMYKKGKAAEAEGKKPLAEFYYEKALEQFDKQTIPGDKKFRELINKALQDLKK